jgi:tetratricopeptide (TPR) repeat protein
MRRRLLLLHLVVAGSICFAAPCGAAEDERAQTIQKKSAEWMQTMRDAEQLVAEKKYAQAIAKYQQIRDERVALGLDLLTENLALADLYEKTNDARKAEELIVATIKMREDQAGDESITVAFPVKAYAEFLARQGRKDEAAKQTERVAFIEKQQNQPPKELVALSARTDLAKPAMAVEAINIGDLYSKRDMQGRALMAYEKAVEWDPKSADAYAARGEAHGFLGKDVQAKKDYDKAIALDPKNVRARYNRALYFESNNKDQQALEDVEAAIKAAPDNKEIAEYKERLLEAIAAKFKCDDPTKKQ